MDKATLLAIGDRWESKIAHNLEEDTIIGRRI